LVFSYYSPTTIDIMEVDELEQVASERNDSDKNSDGRSRTEDIEPPPDGNEDINMSVI
jgi:hypothetical protein